MKTMFWLAVAVSIAVGVFIIRYVLRRLADRERASEQRAAQLLAQMAGAKLPAAAAPAPAPATSGVPTAPNALETQKLLFDAARKAGDAGEPEIALLTYERLLARFPDSHFAGEVRTAAEAQKRKLSKA